ncbi:hypothetical protein ACXX81_13095 [Pseudomonas sp. GNP013]
MKIDPRSLPPAIADKPPAIDVVQSAKPRQGARFDAVLSKRGGLARRTLRDDVEQSCSVSGISPEIFGCTRSLEILEYVLHNVLPDLDAEPQIMALAHDLISEEIDVRRSLEQQRAEVQA